MSSFFNTAHDKYVLPKIASTVPKGAAAWQLYASHPGAAEAARELSDSLQRTLSDVGQRVVAGLGELDALMSKHADLGACDTEPRAELREALEEVLEYLSRELF